MAKKENKFQNSERDEMLNKLIAVRRVTKVVKGGRTMRLAALMVVGDGKGMLGIGTGKATEIPEAIRKATADAKRNMVQVSLVGTTIPHEAVGEFGSSKVIIMPASEGTGVIAGGLRISVPSLWEATTPSTALKLRWTHSENSRRLNRLRLSAARPSKK